jgi:hypothetical protein
MDHIHHGLKNAMITDKAGEFVNHDDDIHNIIYNNVFIALLTYEQ